MSRWDKPLQLSTHELVGVALLVTLNQISLTIRSFLLFLYTFVSCCFSFVQSDPFELILHWSSYDHMQQSLIEYFCFNLFFVHFPSGFMCVSPNQKVVRMNQVFAPCFSHRTLLFYYSYNFMSSVYNIICFGIKK